MPRERDVDAGWTLRWDPAGHSGAIPRGMPLALRDGLAVPATVPGCVHTDLLAAGLVADPCQDRNEPLTSWIGRADWHYETTLRWDGPPAERIDLVFAGLDTAAEIVVAGETRGRTRNMHRSYRFDVTRDLTAGPAALAVRLTSAYTEAEGVRHELGGRPNNYHPEPFNFIRKMACNFGWDWGPTVVTAGIWRPVRLVGWHTARLARVRPEVTVADGDGLVRLRVELDRALGSRVPLRLAARVTAPGPAGGAASANVAVPPAGDSAVVEVVVPRPALWWPRGYGAQPRYDCTLHLCDATTGQELDRWHRRIGFRTVALDTREDDRGSRFTIVVNGEPVFARGVNWIPDDVFPSRMAAGRYRTRLEQAVAANVDLVRVWGGGIYESDDFYDAADELGLLVWQDFLFACAAYPEEEPLRGEVAAEAAENVVRLAHHPSLVLWNGNNENIWGHRDWGWVDCLGDRSWGEDYYLDLLPRIVAELDPTRPYWAGSPWSGARDAHPNDPDHGATHSWEVWNDVDYRHYRDTVPRFVAEFGWQAPPAWATLRAAVADEPLAVDSPGLVHHQRARDGAGKLRRGLERHFPAPETFDRWHYLTQVNQVRAVTTGVEHWRSHWPTCGGTVLWQLNDCWPAISWAAVDSAGRPRPLYHALRRLYADRLLTVAPRDGVPVVVVSNLGARRWSGTLRVRRMGVDGRELAAARLAFDVPPRANRTVPLPAAVTAFGDPAAELLVASTGAVSGAAAVDPTAGERAYWFACPDRAYAYPTARLDCRVSAVPGGLDVTVTARTLVRDLLLQADRLHPAATVDLGLLTLLPSERVTLRVRAPAALDAAAAVVPPVLQAVNLG